MKIMSAIIIIIIIAVVIGLCIRRLQNKMDQQEEVKKDEKEIIPLIDEEDTDSNALPNRAKINIEHPYGNDYVKLTVTVPEGKRYIRCDIAGMKYRDGLDKCLGEFEGLLVPEPENPHDNQAVKILHPNGTHVGYIPRGYDGDQFRYDIVLPHMCQGIILEGESGYYGIVVVVL